MEVSARLRTVKYLSKYIYKGFNRATIEISGRMQDEIKAYLDGWFIAGRSLSSTCMKSHQLSVMRQFPKGKLFHTHSLIC